MCRCTTDLKEGTGDPCAGHERLNGRAAGFVRVKLSESIENFGTDPPIGSKSINIVQNMMIFWMPE